MINRLLLASTNLNKRAEALAAASTWALELPTLNDIAGEAGVAPADVEETASTYLGNAWLKATAYHSWSKMPVVADDSGLEVEALNGAPGIFSARFAGVGASHAENNEKLLRLLGGRANRRARLRSVLVCLTTAGTAYVAEGTLEGTITSAPRGQSGWGYEPLFEVAGKSATIAELKDRGVILMSHRRKAFTNLFALLGSHGVIGGGKSLSS